MMSSEQPEMCWDQLEAPVWSGACSRTGVQGSEAKISKSLRPKKRPRCPRPTDLTGRFIKKEWCPICLTPIDPIAYRIYRFQWCTSCFLFRTQHQIDRAGPQRFPLGRCLPWDHQDQGWSGLHKKRSCFDGRASPNKFSENGESEKPTWQFKLPSGKLT